MIMKIYNKINNPGKSAKWSDKLILTNRCKRAKNKKFNMHNLPKLYETVQENYKNFNKLQSELLYTPTKPQRKLKFESPGGKSTANDGKEKMINNFRNRNQLNDEFMLSDNEIEKARNDEEIIEMEFEKYQKKELEYTKPSTVGSDGQERTYLINKQCKRLEFDNIRYNELMKRKATIYDPCSASTMPAQFQTKERMEAIIEDRMEIEKENFIPENDEIRKTVEKILDKRERKRTYKNRQNGKNRNTKIAEKLNVISVNLNNPISQLDRLFKSYKNAHIICINELREDIKVIKDKRLVKKNWDRNWLPSAMIGLVFSCLVLEVS